MLSLQSTTSDSWLDQVDQDLDSVLIDHAHCEMKAAATAMRLMTAYIENQQLCHDLATIVNEELEHFRLVLDLLVRREIVFKRIKPSSYGRRLHEHIRRQEPDRAVDRLLIASLIEARSCERFSRLRDHFSDHELSEFFGSLFESEARHHATYVRLAHDFATPPVVAERLKQLAAIESEVIAEGDPMARVHS